MGRLGVLAVTICVMLATVGVAPSAAVGVPGRAAVPADDAGRGLVYRGLRPADPAGPCGNGFEVGGPGSGRCTHGPDPAPAGVDVTRPRSLAALAAEEPSSVAQEGAGSILCIDDGTSGRRVQAIYAVASDKADRFASIAPLIPQWATTVDGVFNASAAQTGGVRHVRWVTNPDCSLSVTKVVLSPSGDDSLSDTEDELYAKGFNRADRKYLVWTDANVYCGIAGIYADDRPGQENHNNGVAWASPLVGRVDSGCWGRSNSVEAHELVHMLGGVQRSAPNATSGFHCSDEYDRMCYMDEPSTILSYVCPSTQEKLLDCNNDDYFSTAPPTGSYLATRWNTANSAFLTAASAPAADMTPPAIPFGLAGIPGDGRASLTWFAVSDADLAGYRVSRNGTPIATTTSPAYTDTGLTNGVLQIYTVSAFDAVGNRSLESMSIALTPFGLTAPAATTTTTTPPQPPPPSATTVSAPGGYRLVGADGQTFVFGEGGATGSTGPLPVDPARPVVGAAATPHGTGTWAVTSNGSVYTIGFAPFLGTAAGLTLARPIVGIAATPSGGGYWLVASDGGIFAFGDARFLGSTGAIKLNQPIVGMASTPSGNGYWLVASDGGVFAFGDARFFGSTGAIALNQPITAMVPTPSGAGYRFVASDGGVFSFGDARFLGSAADKRVTVAALVSAR